MSLKLKAAILVPSAAVLLFMVIGGMDGVRASSNSDGAYRQLQVYSEVLSRVRSEYVEDPNIPAVTDGALHGLLESLDANSSFLTAAEYKDYKSHKNAGTADIGAAVSKRFGYAAIIHERPPGYSFLPELAACTADQISIETAQSGLDCAVLAELTGKTIILGVLDLHDMTVETPEQVAGRVRRALPYVPAERIVLAPDCGMKYLPRDVASGKLRAMTQAAGLLRAEG